MKLNLPILSILLCILTGCVTTQFPTLTRDQASLVKKIYIQNEVNEEVEYVRVGTTMFSNKREVIPGLTVKDKLQTLFIAELTKRGYEPQENRNDAQATLTITSNQTKNEPSGIGVDGFGFFTHTFFGGNMYGGTQVQLKIIVTVTDHSKNAVVAKAISERAQMTLVTDSPSTWNGLSSEDKEDLIEELHTQIMEIVPEIISAMGL